MFTALTELPTSGVPCAPMEREYRYFAILDRNHTLADPLVVIREFDVFGGTSEEKFSTKLRWVPSDIRYRILTGHDWDDKAVPIDEEAARRFESIQAERVRRENDKKSRTDTTHP
jgi:hypothetical protein